MHRRAPDALLRDVDVNDDVEVAYVSRKRGAALAEALRKQLDIERHVTDTHDEGQRARHAEDAATIERLLAVL